MKIVVQGTNWIGDSVMAVPALRELRRIFPEAAITLHTRSWAEGIFRDADFIDEILTYEKGGSAFPDVRDQSRVLRQQHFDLAVVFPNSFSSALTSALARIPRRFGYSKDARRLLLTDPIPVPEWKAKRHEVFYYLNLVCEIDEALNGSTSIREIEPELDLKVSSSRRIEARKSLSASGINKPRKLVALGVGSANSRAKRWPAQKYARLNDFLQREVDANVILLGAKNETDMSQQVYEQAKFKPIDLTGKTGIDKATAILSEVDLLISNDMGLAHIAPAVGTKTMVIFGPTDPDTTRPYSPNSTVIRRSVECSPCMLRDCPIDHRCMERITVEEVYEQAKVILADMPARSQI